MPASLYIGVVGIHLTEFSALVPNQFCVSKDALAFHGMLSNCDFGVRQCAIRALTVRTSRVVSNSSPAPKSTPESDAVASSGSFAAAKQRRKGPRRATSAAGSSVVVSTRSTSASPEDPKNDVGSKVAANPAPPATLVAEATETTEATETSEAEVAVSPSPIENAPANTTQLSRRQRRLAEAAGQSSSDTTTSGLLTSAPETHEGPEDVSVPQSASKPEPGVTRAPASHGSSQRPKPSSTSQRTPNPRKSRNRVWLWLRGTLLFMALAAIVLGLGVVTGQQNEPQTPPSTTEVDRAAGLERVNELQANASTLLTSTKDAKAKAALASVVDALGKHAQALAPSGEATASPTPAATVTPAQIQPSVTALTTGLTDSASTFLDQALTANPGMSRVFAATGTSQLLLARELASTAVPQTGAGVPGDALVQASATLKSPTAPTCTSPQAEASVPPSENAPVSLATALANAAHGEQKAVYAYQVIAARADGALRTEALSSQKVHQDRLEILNESMRAQCLETLKAVPGYALDPAFMSTPALAAASMEGELALAYGDLASLSPAVISPAESPGSSPRQIGVACLLTSTLSQQTWGGQLTALPGIPA